MIPLTDDRLRQIAYDDIVCASDQMRAMAVELIAARASLARVTAMVDHGLHSEDPDEHDCDARPCWAVALRKAIGIEETDGD